MQHGLSVGMWMMTVALIGLWLWQAGVLKKVWNIPMSFWAPFLLIVHILVKSTGAYLYMFFGIIILFTAKWFRKSWGLSLLAVGIAFYLLIATTGNFTSQRVEQVTSLVSSIAPPDRVASLNYRFYNEGLLIDKARERFFFGWGGYDRNRVYDQEGTELSTAIDSLWIYTFGVRGFVGLASLYASALLPIMSFCWQGYPARTWFNPKVAPVAMLAVVLGLYMLDSTLNNQPNPVFTVISGV